MIDNVTECACGRINNEGKGIDGFDFSASSTAHSPTVSRISLPARRPMVSLSSSSGRMDLRTQIAGLGKDVMDAVQNAAADGVKVHRWCRKRQLSADRQCAASEGKEIWSSESSKDSRTQVTHRTFPGGNPCGQRKSTSALWLLVCATHASPGADADRMERGSFHSINDPGAV